MKFLLGLFIYLVLMGSAHLFAYLGFFDGDVVFNAASLGLAFIASILADNISEK